MIISQMKAWVFFMTTMMVVTGINVASSFLLITPNNNSNSFSASRSITEASLHNVLFSSRSSIDTLQQQIIQGATLKMMKRNDQKPSPPLKEQKLKEVEVGMDTPCNDQYTYYVRKARRSEINDITDILMASFHSQSQQPTFDSYVRRYKSNHLRMCFDAFDESDRGIFVACASATSGSTYADETLVGFCLVDGRKPDTSCQVEFLTPSTLEATSPRPYLSDLGVIPSHRRRGIGELLVQACETWAVKRGYDKIYLKVEESNKPGVRLYYGMRYRRTKLPWTREMNKEERTSTMLLEKSLAFGTPTRRRRKRTWIKEQVLEPVMNRLGNKNDGNMPPL